MLSSVAHFGIEFPCFIAASFGLVVAFYGHRHVWPCSLVLSQKIFLNVVVYESTLVLVPFESKLTHCCAKIYTVELKEKRYWNKF